MRISATTLQTGLVVIILSWALVPQLADDLFARLLCVLSVAIWGGVEATKPHGVFRRPPVVMLLYLFFCLYTLLLEFMTHGASGAVSRLQLYIMLFFLPLFLSLRNAPERLYFLFWVFISLSALAMTTTYLYLSSFDARAMRVVVRASQEAIELQNAGVGGLAMAYNAALLFPVLLVASLQPALVEGLRPPRLLRIIPKLPVMLVWY